MPVPHKSALSKRGNQHRRAGNSLSAPTPATRKHAQLAPRAVRLPPAAAPQVGTRSDAARNATPRLTRHKLEGIQFLNSKWSSAMTATIESPAPDVDVDEPGTQTPRVFEISADRAAEARKRIETANRRLARSGATERFEWTEEAATRTVARPEGDRVYEIVVFTLSEPRIQAGSWRFQAAVEIIDSGTLLHAPAFVDADNLPRPDKHYCAQCGTLRARNRSYLLRNDDTGEIAQVGSNCLVPFLGMRPSGLFALEWRDLDDLAVDPAADDNDMREYFRGAPELVDPRQIIAVSWVLTDGGRHYVSRDRAADEQIAPTAMLVGNVLDPEGAISWDERQWRRDMADEAAQIDADTIDAVLATVDDLDGTYGDNMRVATASQGLGPRNWGLVASLVKAYRRGQEKDAERASRPAVVDGYLGEPKEKIEGIEGTVTKLVAVDTQWGVSTVLIVHADSGHLLKWFTSALPEEVDGETLDVGQKVVVTRATVKGHDEYKGQAQTSVTRVKLARPAA